MSSSKVRPTNSFRKVQREKNENDDDSDAIYLNGAWGQRIAISPNKQRIMIVFSYKENYMGELYKLFASW